MDNSNGRPLAVVTGASSGIGQALAEEFAEQGFDLVVAAEDRAIEDIAARLRAGAPDAGKGKSKGERSHSACAATAVQVDLATPQGNEELYRRVRAIGTPRAVAINAGVGVNGPFAETPLEAHLSLVDLNVRAAVHLARLVLPDMVRAGEGGLLFTSSIAATMPGPYLSTYSASKAFLYSLAEALHTELADTGVTVTALMPGPTDTKFFARAGMEDTKLGQTKKDDPREVAREGVHALFEGKDHVIAGSAKNRAQVAAAKVAPDSATAAMHAKMSKPGSGKH